MLSKFALIVTDLHSAPANTKYTEGLERRENIGSQQVLAPSQLGPDLSLLCTGIYTTIMPIPALLLPGFPLKSKASIWKKLRFPFSSATV